MFIIKEDKEKIKRIDELRLMNFNVPRSFFLEKDSRDIPINLAFSWAEKIFKSNKDQIFNIRTYNYSKISKKESLQSPHLTDLTFEKLVSLLPKTNFEYACMIDAEIPDNGRIAGNIAIEENKKFSLEFVIKEKRAMVRDINSHIPLHSITGNYNNPLDPLLLSYNEKLEKLGIDPLTFSNRLILFFIVNKAIDFKKENIILEFTYFNIPSGIFYDQDKFSPVSNIVWWEYRSF